MKKGKVLITEVIHPILKQRLEKNGFECDHFEQITYSQIASRIATYNGLVVRSKIKVDRALIDQAPVLQFIARSGSGMELIDTAYAKQKGINCISAPEGNCAAVAEHALGMLLTLLHRISIAQQELKTGIWDRIANRGTELGGMTVGIIGYGNTGSAFAQRLQGFNVQVIAYDKYKQDFSNDFCEAVSLETLFERADILSLHIPLTKETLYWIDLHFIRQFHKPVYLINTSRGKIVRTQDVLTALQQGLLRGAVLDVLENEKLATYNTEEQYLLEQLLMRPDVILTPHIAGVTHQSFFKMANVLATKIIGMH